MHKFKWLLILAALFAAAWYPLVLHSPKPQQPPSFKLDIEKARALGDQVRGPKPSQLKVEHIATFKMTESMVMAGAPWRSTPIPVYAYKLQFPGRWLIIDTALPNTSSLLNVAVSHFDEQALQRLYQAMDKAAGIYITHEHFDHIGGLVSHPRIESIIDKAHLSQAQFDHPDRMIPLSYPEQLFDDYQAMDYDDMLAIAPGVVLIKAPGHTPGSQMVFIQLSNGKEILLLGDVSWQNRNLQAVKERPLFMTAMIREDREAVINQFQALKELREQEPAIHLVPGHDAQAMQELLASGVIHGGF